VNANTPACCCRATSTPVTQAREAASRPMPWRVNLTGWLLPGALLVLLPKCPACMAAYIATATGLGISLPAAANVRLMLIMLCLASLSLLAWRTLRRLRQGRTGARS
jgi:hypothetical protein